MICYILQVLSQNNSIYIYINNVNINRRNREYYIRSNKC